MDEDSLYLDRLPQNILDNVFIYLDSSSLRNLELTSSSVCCSVQNFKRSHEKHFNELTKNQREQSDKSNKINRNNNNNHWLLKASLSLVLLVAVISAILSNGTSFKARKQMIDEGIRINLEQIDQINENFPGLFSPKELRIIKTRLAFMKREVSILMLLGKSRDIHCKLDPTFCVGQTIANATNSKSYIDASDPRLRSNILENELGQALIINKNTVVIDNLEQLPGSEVMKLFQFIDKDETRTRRGMLLFIVYVGPDLRQDHTDLKEAELAEKVLVDRWSPFIAKDSLTSVLSRICSSIVKAYRY